MTIGVDEIIGARSYLALVLESTWGTLPGSPDYVHVPVSSYEAVFTPENRQSRPYTGQYQDKHSVNPKGMVLGNLVAPLCGWKESGSTTSLMQQLIDWAYLLPESRYLTSYQAEWAEGPDVANKRHAGMRVNTCQIDGSEQSNFVQISLGLMGKDEANFATAQTIPNDREDLLDCEFQDVVFTLDSVATAINAFSLSKQNGLKAVYNNARKPQLLFRTQNKDEFSFTIPKASNTYDAIRLAVGTPSTFVGSLAIKGLHNSTGSTGSFTVATASMPRMRFVNMTDAGAMEDIRMTTVQCKLLKPDTSSHAVSWDYTEA